MSSDHKDGQDSEHDKNDKLSKLRSEDSKEDENLVQNWSLTYTEYENRYTDGQGTSRASKDHVSASKGQASEKLHIIDKDVKFPSKDTPLSLPADDGRNSEYRRRHAFSKAPESMQEAHRQQIAEHFTNLERSKALYLQGVRLSNDPFAGKIKQTEYESDGVSRTGDVVLKQTVENETENYNKINRKYAKEQRHPHTPDDVTEDGQMDGNLSRHSVLPPLEGKPYGSGSDKLLENNLHTSGTEVSNISNAMSVASGNKPPRNTPHTQNGGRIQQIYMRFPGQITGQRVL